MISVLYVMLGIGNLYMASEENGTTKKLYITAGILWLLCGIARAV